MTISSRTPEGTPNRCTLCGYDCRLEPSIDTHDAPCPACGHLLWFPKPANTRSSRHLSYEGFVMRVGRGRLGPLPIALQLPLMCAIEELRRRGRLPEQAELAEMIAGA